MIILFPPHDTPGHSVHLLESTQWCTHATLHELRFGSSDRCGGPKLSGQPHTAASHPSPVGDALSLQPVAT